MNSPSNATKTKRSKKTVGFENDMERARIRRDFDEARKVLVFYSKSRDFDPVVESIVDGEYHLESGKLIEAQDILTKGHKQDPQDLQLVCLLFKLSIAQNNPEEGIRYLQQVPLGKVIEDLQNYSTVTVRLCIEALWKRGFYYESLAKHKLAIESYQTLVEMALKHSEVNPGVSFDAETTRLIEESLIRLSSLQLKLRNVAGGTDALRSSISRTPGPSRNFLKRHLGSVLLRQSDMEQHIISKGELLQGEPIDITDEALILLLSYDKAHQRSHLHTSTNNSAQSSLTAGPTNISSSLPGATSLHDEICLAFCRKFGYHQLIQVFEEVICAQYGDFHGWLEFALSLLASNKIQKALVILKHCISLQPGDSTLLLLFCQVCINQNMKLEEAVVYAQRIVDLNRGKSVQRTAKGLHALGLAFNKMSLKDIASADRETLQNKALSALLEAHQLDGSNYLISYHVALQHAEIKNITEALRFARASLLLNRAHADCWNLCALLLSSQNMYEEALVSVSAGLEENDDISLLIFKAKIQMALGQSNDALSTCKEVFCKWKLDFLQSDDNESVNGDFHDHKSVESSVRDGDIDADRKSVIYSHTMSVYSENMSQTGGLRHQNISDGDLFAVNMWLTASDIFRQLDLSENSHLCVQEARIYNSFSPDSFCEEGKILEAQKRRREAAIAYQKALNLDSSHRESLLRLGALSYLEGNNVLAERYLSTAVRNDPFNWEAWLHLGNVYDLKGDAKKAGECFLKSAELGQTTPILSVFNLKRNL
eukprot:TRINITY_DN9081_c0_g1_i2.p1 TRINITY_DN9081_c0_g1~~TRINITY_DN9081_c0_g1_i2.p1  ORF type:complete len:769 (-),score=132.69 TRINITY_DN9081_c0_g1_i2:86-2392(-)